MRNKRVFDLWQGFATFDRLLKAFYRAARGKFDCEAVLRFHGELEANLFRIKSDLSENRYEWGAYRRFWVVDPKLRLIESAPFRDRVVHHALAEVLEPIFEPSFYFHSYACRAAKGSHAAVKKLRAWVGNHPHFHYLQMDVMKFFPSIDRNVLYRLVEQRIGDECILRLIRSLLDTAPGEIGIPIGNLTSQLFANLYLDPLDQFIKRELRVPLYVRYMDDVILLSKSRAELLKWRILIESFGKESLHLRFHPNKVILGKVTEGIGFLGYRTYPWGIFLRGKSVRRFRQRLKEPLTLEKKVRRLLSYQAHLKHARNGPNLILDFQKIAFCGEAFFMKH